MRSVRYPAPATSAARLMAEVVLPSPVEALVIITERCSALFRSSWIWRLRNPSRTAGGTAKGKPAATLASWRESLGRRARACGDPSLTRSSSSRMRQSMSSSTSAAPAPIVRPASRESTTTSSADGPAGELGAIARCELDSVESSPLRSVLSWASRRASSMAKGDRLPAASSCAFACAIASATSVRSARRRTMSADVVN